MYTEDDLRQAVASGAISAEALVQACFDRIAAREPEVQAWAWLDAEDCPGANDPVLFCRLLETPFDDLRLKVIDLLERRNLPGEARGGLIPVWTAVLLGSGGGSGPLAPATGVKYHVPDRDRLRGAARRGAQRWPMPSMIHQ